MTGFILPTKDEFRALFLLFPKGNIEKAFIEVNYVITNKKLFDGNPVTWDLIKSKFTEYYDIKKRENTEPKWIKGIESFVKAGDYEIDFSMYQGSSQKTNFFGDKMDEAMNELKRKLNL